MHSQLLEIVRNLVHARFSAGTTQAAGECCETILVRDGFYCGRCFAHEGHRAIWLVDQPHITFFDESGQQTARIPVPSPSGTSTSESSASNRAA